MMFGGSEELEARKMLDIAAESHTSGARFVGPKIGKCVPKGVLTLHHCLQCGICLFTRHYPSPIEVHIDCERDGMRLDRNS